MRKSILAALMLLLLASLALAEDDDEHRYGRWMTKRFATCTQEGLQFRYCLHCDHWEQRRTKKLPHQVAEYQILQEPTCTKEGVRSGYCTVCGSYCRNKIEPLGHDWEVVSSTKKPTCTKGGYGKQQCRRCGKSREGVIEKLGHQWGEWTVLHEPAGQKRGSREHTCSLCKKTEKEYFYAEGTLYQDMEPCREVVALQTMLTDLNYYKGKIGTGSFGAQTGKAVARFQKSHKLKETKACDPPTMEALIKSWEKKTGRSADELFAEQEKAEDADGAEQEPQAGE